MVKGRLIGEAHDVAVFNMPVDEENVVGSPGVTHAGPRFDHRLIVVIPRIGCCSILGSIGADVADIPEGCGFCRLRAAGDFLITVNTAVPVSGIPGKIRNNTVVYDIDSAINITCVF